MTISPYLFPVIFNIFVFFFCFLPSNDVTLYLGTIATFIDLVVIPIFLTVLTEKKAKGRPFKKLLLYLLSVLICILGEVITYCGSGLATGTLLTPDSITVLLVNYSFVVLAIVFAVSVIVARIVNLVKYLRKKKSKAYSPKVLNF